MLIFGAIAILGIVLLGVSLLFDDLLGDLIDLPFLSGTALGGFCAAFGFAGIIGVSATDSIGVGIGAGLASGVLVGGLGAALTHTLRKDDGTESPSMSSVVGRTGVVVAAITGDSFGSVSVTIGSHVNRYSARCATPVAAGAQVEVVASLSSTAVVVRPVTP